MFHRLSGCAENADRTQVLRLGDGDLEAIVHYLSRQMKQVTSSQCGKQEMQHRRINQ
jgi:hypothetical protein